MAAYQSQAVRPALSVRCGDLPPEINALPPGDLYISLNAHSGRPEYLTSLIDPSVTDESDPTSTDSSLDMFSPANGPPYSADFVAHYRKAQTSRNHKITAWVLEELERLHDRGHGDRMFSVPRVWADLRFLDPSLDPSDRQPGLCYAGVPQTANRGALGVARAVTLNAWLAMWSLEHSQCRAAPHLKNIEIPSLVVQSMQDVGVFPSDAHAIHDGLCASDKRLLFVPGTHFFETPVGAYDACADVLADWLREHHA
jgi:pimeloyl-ACP methyl ester carboxylesterase